MSPLLGLLSASAVYIAIRKPPEVADVPLYRAPDGSPREAATSADN
jgi:hypothetical protein